MIGTQNLKTANKNLNIANKNNMEVPATPIQTKVIPAVNQVSSQTRKSKNIEKAFQEIANKSSNNNKANSKTDVHTLKGGVVVEGYNSLNDKQKANLETEVDKYKAKILASIKDGSFDKVIEKSFQKESGGANLDDKAGLDAMKHAALSGDWSKVIPTIKIGGEKEFSSALDSKGNNLFAAGLNIGGAFISNSTDYKGGAGKIILNKELLNNPSNPNQAGMNFQSILTEETAHAWDARFNKTDSKGDEGEVVSILFDRSNVTNKSLNSLMDEIEATGTMLDDVTKALNQIDHGTMMIDGKETDVEFGFGSFFKKAVKSVVKGVKKVAGKVGDVATDIYDGAKKVVNKVIDLHKDAFRFIRTKVLESQWFNTLVTVFSVLPIPGVQQAAWVAQMAIGANKVVQGAEDGDWRRVAAGAVSAMSGAPAGAFGATAATVANAARTGLQVDAAIRAANNGDITGMFMAGAGAAGATGFISPEAMLNTQRIAGAINAVQNNDTSRIFDIALGYAGRTEIGQQYASELEMLQLGHKVFGSGKEADKLSSVLNYGSAAGLWTEDTAKNINTAYAIRNVIKNRDVDAGIKMLEKSGHLDPKFVSSMKMARTISQGMSDKQWGQTMKAIANSGSVDYQMASNLRVLGALYEAKEDNNLIQISDIVMKNNGRHFNKDAVRNIANLYSANQNFKDHDVEALVKQAQEYGYIDVTSANDFLWSYDLAT